MKKQMILLALLWVSLCTQGLRAQALLNETFESWSSVPSAGWRTIEDQQAGSVTHWELLQDEDMAIAGKRSVMMDGMSFEYDEPLKEELLVTPKLTLDDQSYKLDFYWLGASRAAFDEEYDFQVRVSEDNGVTSQTIWSFLNAEQVEDSGVDFPWAAWTKYRSVVDLSAYKGKTIEIAFVYVRTKTGLGTGNVVRLDNVLVEPFEPITGPVVAGSDACEFFDVYVGQKKYSDVMLLKNVGKETLRIEAINGIEGSDFSTSLDVAKVAIAPNEAYEYHVVYCPSLTGKPNVTMQIQTNGGTLDVNLKGTKRVIAEDATLEGFEGEEFVPLGWTSTGDWSQADRAFLGDHCASVSYSERSELISPRLDLSSGAQSVTFDYAELYTATHDGATGPENYFEVMFSKDGGYSWTTVFSNTMLNEEIRKTVDLGTPASDNCYVKWVYYFDYFNSNAGWDELPEFSDVYLDNVVLPLYYGANELPKTTTPVYPTHQAKQVSTNHLTLEWEGVPFATGYKVYVGTSTNDFSVIDGQDVGLTTSFQMPLLQPSTLYYWTVVPYNAYGEVAMGQAWQFETMADASISTFPWNEGFEGEVFPAHGWYVEEINGAAWDYTSYKPFDGERSAFVTGRGDYTGSSLETPNMVLPEDEPMQVSFYWANQVPVSVTKPMHQAPSVKGDTIYFEVFADNVWHTLAKLSEESTVWKKERIMLDAYKGKTINMRWRYLVENNGPSTGACLDNILVETASLQGKPVLNRALWDAGDVNYNMQKVEDRSYVLANEGEQSLEIAAIEMTHPNNFSTTLQTGMVLAKDERKPFNLTFSAHDASMQIEGSMTIRFTDQQEVVLAIKGNALPATTRYFDFENDVYGNTTVEGLTLIDEDRCGTVGLDGLFYPSKAAAYAFVVINYMPAPEGANWPNVYPCSGYQVLAAMSPSQNTVTASDWAVSPQMQATSQSRFRFFARSYASNFEKSKVTVLVSTTDMSLNSFEPVPACDQVEIPYSVEGQYTEFDVDLSAYAGQQVYVALKHEVSSDGLTTFFDDFYYEHFEANVTSLDEVSALRAYPNPVVDYLHIPQAVGEEIIVTNAQGQILFAGVCTGALDMQHYPKGVYFVRMAPQHQAQAIRVLKQ